MLKFCFSALVLLAFNKRSLASACENTPDWYDSDGYHCADYEGSSNDCASYGDTNENFGKTANQACCYCKSQKSTSRLVYENGDPTSSDYGLLQLRVGGVWKYVCDDEFDKNNNGANVACIEMGFESGSHKDGKAPPGKNEFYDDISCTGHESHLADCKRSNGRNNCGKREAVQLSCKSKPSQGSLEAKLARALKHIEKKIAHHLFQLHKLKLRESKLAHRLSLSQNDILGEAYRPPQFIEGLKEKHI